MAHLRICRGFGLVLGMPPEWAAADITFDNGDQIEVCPIKKVWAVLWRRTIIGIVHTGPLEAGRAALRGGKETGE